MSVSVGDEVWFDGYLGTVVAVTDTIDASGYAEISYGGLTWLARVLKARIGPTEYPLSTLPTGDNYFRIGLIVHEPVTGEIASGTKYAMLVDDLSAPLGWGRIVGGSHSKWQTTPAPQTISDPPQPEDVWVEFEMGWAPGTLTVQNGGVTQASVYVDFVLYHQTDEGEHESWWQPAYPSRANTVWGAEEGRFKTDGSGVVYFCASDGTLSPLIFPRGMGARCHRLQDTWSGAPEPECYLTALRLYYLGEWIEVTESASATLDVASGILELSGPPNGKYTVFWEGALQRGQGTLDGSGNATLTGLVLGKYTAHAFHPSDDSYYLPRKSANLTATGQTISIDVGSSWIDWSGESTCRVIAYLDGSEEVAAGAQVWGYVGSEPNHGWQYVGAVGESGIVDVGFGTGGICIIDSRGCARTSTVTSAGQVWDPQIAWRIGTCAAGKWSVTGSSDGGLLNWGEEGAHSNLPLLNRMAYMRDTTDGSKHYFYATTQENGTVSETMPNMVFDLSRAYYPLDPPSTVRQFQLYDSDDTRVSATTYEAFNYPAVQPPWYTSSPAYNKLFVGRPIAAQVGGKNKGAVIEADRSTCIVKTEEPKEALRLGLEFGRWQQSLRVGHHSEALEAWCDGRELTYRRSLTWTSEECAYCGGPVFADPDDGTYTRGYCTACTDAGFVQDERTWFQTRTFPAGLSDFWTRLARVMTSGMTIDRLIKQHFRPEDYAETNDYLEVDWESLGLDRWEADHITFGTLTGGAFSDGYSVTTAEAALGRHLGPMMLKLELLHNYSGTGKEVTVTALRADNGLPQDLTVMIPPDSETGDMFPLNWAPHHDYPRGYYTDVTNATEEGDGYLSARIVNDGPAMHSATGTEVTRAAATLWASDVLLATRDPDLATDFSGRLHIVYCRDGWVIHRIQQGHGVWHDEANVTLSARVFRSHSDPSVLPDDTGRIVVSAHRKAGVTNVFESQDDGQTWEQIN